MGCREHGPNNQTEWPRDIQTELVAELVEQYLACVEAGEPMDIDTYLQRHPAAVADRVRNCLASLQMVRGMSREMDDAAPSMEDSVPDQLGEFRIIRELGRGGMGIVYEAEQESLQRRVALKVLPFASLMSQNEIERFNNEARAAAMLTHPNIVSVYSVGSERGLNYYAMELVDGVSLAEVVSDLSSDRVSKLQSTSRLATFSTQSTSTSGYCDDVARLIARTARAINFAHQNGVVHRDVKPFESVT